MRYFHRRFFVSCLLFLSLCPALFGQYPKDELIEPYPRALKERTPVFRFDSSHHDLSAWNALHQCTLMPGEDTQKAFLRIRSSGADPYFQLPPIPVDTAPAGHFECVVRMKNNIQPKAEFFWGTDAEPDYRPENSAQFNFVDDDQFRTYSIRFKTDAPLTRLRFDPGTSRGEAEIEFLELARIVYDDSPPKKPKWFDPRWSEKVRSWKTVPDGQVEVRFDEEGRGACLFLAGKRVGEIYPLVHFNPDLPLVDATGFPIPEIAKARMEGIPPVSACTVDESGKTILFRFHSSFGPPGPFLEFSLDKDELKFRLSWNETFSDTPVLGSVPVFGPVFRPGGALDQAVLCGVEYLEAGEHSSSTADLETSEHLRFAPKTLDITWPFQSIVTDEIGFGLLWDDPDMQPVFATPDFILADSTSHYMGLHGFNMSGTLKIRPRTLQRKDTEPNDLEEMILWGVRKRGLPNLPRRFRDDQAQRKLNLDGFERSILRSPAGWRHAVMPGMEDRFFSPIFGSDFVSAIWQLTGKLPEVPRLDHGGGHLRNPVSFFLMGKADEYLNRIRAETAHILEQQKEDGSFRYRGQYLKGHWEDTASGYCGNQLFRLMDNHRVLGDPAILRAVRRGLEFANQYSTPRGAQTWELSLHTPDIMGSSRMCLANTLMFEATGETRYLDAARRWALSGLPFVYLRTSERIKARAPGAPEAILDYATTPVFGATNYQAPNWIGLPVQWCGLDYGEALFRLARHDRTLDWKKIAEAILIAAEQMQYTDGPCIGLLPDSFEPANQRRNPFDINPSVLVMQRRRLEGKPDSLEIALNKDGSLRVASPFKTSIQDGENGPPVIVIEAEAGISYQILVNGSDIRTIASQGTDRIEIHGESRDHAD